MKTLLVVLLLVTSLILGIVTGISHHKYEVKKCKVIGDNDYNKSSCYNPIYNETFNLYSNIVLFSFLYLCVISLLLVLYFIVKDIYF